MLNLCGVCRTNTADLISLKFNDAGTKRILYKLKYFISADVSTKKSTLFTINYIGNSPLDWYKCLCYNFLMYISQLMNYDPYLTSFICLQCFNDLEVAFKFKRTCEALNAGRREALKPIPKPSQINGSKLHENQADIKK